MDILPYHPGPLLDDKSGAKQFRLFVDRCNSINEELGKLNEARHNLVNADLDSLLVGEAVMNLRRKQAEVTAEEIQLRQEMDVWACSLEPLRKQRYHEAIEAVEKAREAAAIGLRSLGYLDPQTDGPRFRPGMIPFYNGAVNAAPGVVNARVTVGKLHSLSEGLKGWREQNQQGFNEAKRRRSQAKQAVLMGL